MPYESWYRLHHGSGLQRISAINCPVCEGKREATIYICKLFLVAERLTWEADSVSMSDRNLNANLNSKLNHELGIPSRVVNFPEHVPSGKHSKTNKYHPYENEHEMMLALKLLFMTDNWKAAAWSL
jgi:hypothetical protein